MTMSNTIFIFSPKKSGFFFNTSSKVVQFKSVSIAHQSFLDSVRMNVFSAQFADGMKPGIARNDKCFFLSGSLNASKEGHLEKRLDRSTCI